MIQAIFFDLDDTLFWDSRCVTEALEATCALAHERYQIDARQLESTVRIQAKSIYESMDTYPFALMIGTGPMEALWARYEEGEGFAELRAAVPQYRFQTWRNSLQAFGIDDEPFAELLANTFPIERRKLSHVYPETYEVLDQLKMQTYKLLLLTNGSPDLQKEKLSTVPKLLAYFDQILISGEFGVGKPDLSLFKYALDHFSLQPHEVIMVGDKLSTDIKGANLSGIPSVWINREQLPTDPAVEPSYTITNLCELEGILKTLTSSNRSR